MAKKSVPDEVLQERLVVESNTARSTMLARNKLIMELHDRGHSLRAIGELAGLSHTQVGNITRRAAA